MIRSIQRLVLSPMIWVLFLGLIGAACLNAPALSPEGTATSDALNRNAAVYAPRAARAQKVIFDDPSKEMIYAPDTPLRRFFDAHARDFNDKDLDYAKTTILMDIVAMVRGREYLGRVVREVIDRHSATALRPGVWPSRHRDALEAHIAVAENAVPVVNGARNFPTQRAAAKKLAEELRRIFELSAPHLEWARAENELDFQGGTTSGGQAPNPVPSPIALEKVLKRLIQVQGHLAVGASNTSPPNDVWGDFPVVYREALKSLEAQLAALDRDRGLALLDAQPEGIPEGAKLAAAREHNAELLAKAVELELLQANYPDIRDDAIAEVIRRFTGKQGRGGPSERQLSRFENPLGLWKATTLAGAPYARVAVENLERDLLHTLETREFLLRIIESAVSKRKDLFRSTGSSLAALQKAQSELRNFVTKNLGDAYSAGLESASTSTWMRFLTVQTLESGHLDLSGGAVPGTKPTTVGAFATALRKVLETEIEKESDLEKAMLAALKDGSLQTRIRTDNPSGTLGTGPTKAWSEALSQDASLKKALGELRTLREAVSSAHALAETSKKERESSVTALATSAKTGGPVAASLEKAATEWGAELAAGLSTFVSGYHADADSLQSKRNQNDIVPLIAALDTWVDEVTGAAVIAPNEVETVLLTAHHYLAIVAGQATTADGLLGAALTQREACIDAVKTRVAELNTLGKNAKKASANAPLETLSPALESITSFKKPALVFAGTSSSTGKWIEALGALRAQLANDLSLLDPTKPHPPTFQFDTARATQVKTLLVELQARLTPTNGGYWTATQSVLDPLAIRSSSTKTLLDAEIPKLGDWLATARDAQSKASTAKARSEDLEKARSEFSDALGSTADPKAGDLAFALLAAIDTEAAKPGDAPTLDKPKLVAHLHKALAQAFTFVEGKNSPTSDLGSLMLPHLASFPAATGGDEHRDAFAKAFAGVFAGHADLVSSDDTPLVALLKSPAVTFGTDESRARAAQTFPTAFREAVTTSVTSTPSGGDSSKKTPSPNASKYAEAAAKALEVPALSSLFAVGSVNENLAQAFSLELFHAFKHRIHEAVDLEREAAYDYWWITLYPKAVALGNSSFEGESLFEVSLAESLIPKEEYARWLHDLGYIDRQMQEVRDREEDARFIRVLKVLTDFMAVLDSSNLVGRYPGVREAVQQLIADISRERHNPNVGLKHLIDEFTQLAQDSTTIRAVRAIEQVTQKLEDRVEKLRKSDKNQGAATEDWDGILKEIQSFKGKLQVLLNESRGTKQSDNKEPAAPTDVGTDDCDKNWNCAIACSDSIACAISNKRPAHARKDSGEPKGQSPAKDVSDGDMQCNDDLDDAIQYASAARELLESTRYAIISGDATTYFQAFRSHPDLDDPHGLDNSAEGVRQLGSLAAAELAWADFSLEHIALAVSRTYTEESALPFQVDLYLSALIPGSLRFHPRLDFAEVRHARRILGTDRAREIEAGLADRFLTQFRARGLAKDMGTFLSLVGVGENSINHLEARLKYLLANTTNNISFHGELRRDAAQAFTKSFLDVAWGPPVDLTAQEVNSSAINVSLDPSDLFRSYSRLNRLTRDMVVRWLLKDVEYLPGRRPSRYLQHPDLWDWERRLAGLQAELREEASHLFHSAYPGVPDRMRLRDQYSHDDARLEILVYQWIRDLWVTLRERESDASAPGAQPGRNPKSSARVLVGIFLDRHMFLSPDARESLIGELGYHQSIYDWVNAITGNRELMDQLSGELLDVLYAPLFDALWTLSQTEHHPIQRDKLKRTAYDRFLDRASPKIQTGIQIVDMLPSSRDDLVSMSINEGGVVAQLAGQAEGAAIYDISALATLERALSSTGGSFSGSEAAAFAENPGSTEEGLTSRSNSRSLNDAQDILAADHFRRELQRRSLAGSASGTADLYARARSAYSFARRREYLDAAITAAGRGDSAARWVIRESDTRSSLTSGDRRKNLAAAHTGQPNGDQPFHLLVKVPHDAIQTDWQGNRYLLFNSNYSAVTRKKTGRNLGTLRFLAQPLVWLLHQDAWKNLESDVMVSSFPFRWDSTDDATEMVRTPNFLGGRIHLDDTDKIRHSEVLALIDAESAFIRTTRSLQLTDIERVRGEISTEHEAFQTEVQAAITRRVESQEAARARELEASRLDEVKTELEARLAEIEKELEELQNPTPPPGGDPVDPGSTP